MIKRILVRTVCILIASCIAIFSCGCSDKSFESQSIAYQTVDNILSLDPQLAQTSAEATAVVNSFDGLVRIDNHGNIIPAAAKSYDVSADGLTYTFTLRENMFWSDEKTKVTADDFVYGLTRAVAPETKAPYAGLLFAISNAEDVFGGKVDRSRLGVKKQSDSILTITLSHTDFNFLNTLARPIAMPCNKAFFESTKGKYGLDIDNIISNGAYSLKRWNNEDFSLRLVRNDNYNGENKAVPCAVSIGYNREYTSILNNLTEQSIDCGYAQGEDITRLNNIGYSAAQFFNTSYVLYVSPDIGTKKLRKVLASTIDRLSVTGNLPSFYKDANGIVPSTAKEGDKNYRECSGEVSPELLSEQQLKNELRNIDSSGLTEKMLYYPSSSDITKLTANIIAQNWQKGLNASVNTEEKEPEQIWEDIYSGDIKLAIIPVTGFGGTAYNSLSSFLKLGFGDYDNLLKKNVPDINEYCSGLKAAEQYLLNNYYIYPLYFTPEIYCSDSTVDKITFGSTGNYIDFKYCEKTVK